MSKIPVKPIVNLIKDGLPKAGEIIKQNPKGTVKTLAAIVATSTEAVEKFQDFKEKRKENKDINGKVHYRKIKYFDYHRNILPQLDSSTYIQLIAYRLEVESFMNQITNAQKSEKIINKPLHLKRYKSWNEILIQIEDKMKSKNYEELLKLYNNPEYNCTYFELRTIEYIKAIEDKKELYQFIIDYTSKDINEIKKDFI